MSDETKIGDFTGRPAPPLAPRKQIIFGNEHWVRLSDYMAMLRALQNQIRELEAGPAPLAEGAPRDMEAIVGQVEIGGDSKPLVIVMLPPLFVEGQKVFVSVRAEGAPRQSENSAWCPVCLAGNISIPGDSDNLATGSEHSRTDGEGYAHAADTQGPANMEAATKNAGAIQQIAERLGIETLHRAEGAPRDWQPIETAPKDGTNVLLWWPFWCKNRPTIGFLGYKGIQQWIAPEALEGDGDAPTHWMPLPVPPLQENKA